MNDILIAERIGEFVGAFLLTLIMYKIIQYLALRNKQSVLNILLRFIVSTLIVVPFIGYGEYNYIKPIYTHVPFLLVYAIIDSFKLKLSQNKISNDIDVEM